MLRFGSEPVGERIKKIVLRKRGFFFFLPQKDDEKEGRGDGADGKMGEKEKKEQQTSFFDFPTQAWSQFLRSFWVVIVEATGLWVAGVQLDTW